MSKNAFLYLLLALVAYIVDVAALVAKAPKVTVNAYDEVIPMLQSSKLIYDFAEILEEVRKGDVALKIPHNFPDVSRFSDESADLREFNDGKGLSLTQVLDLLRFNKDNLYEIFGDSKEFELDMLENLEAAGMTDQVYLSTLRTLRGNIACVYGVVKDVKNKRIIVAFRGSQTPFSNRDWKSNLNARMVDMRTPKKIKDKMDGVVQERVLVHKGFYDYLFDNKFLDGQQRYDQICTEVQTLMEEGYSLYITGHSLGAALATMFSFKLAGAGKKRDWVPRPLTCITFAAPFSGGSSYRAAFEQEELDGLIRSLRINDGEDIIPALPPFSLGGKKRLMKHTGINCRLYNGGLKFAHTSRDGFLNNICNSISNSLFKPVWNILSWHSLKLHYDRIVDTKERLSETTIDELYKDETVVGSNFLSGRTRKYDSSEAGE